MKILIIGAGAIGCLVGGKLAKSGQPVTLVGRPSFAQRVQAQGLTLLEGEDRHTLTATSSMEQRPLSVVGCLADAFQRWDQPFDLAILTVKSYDTEQTLRELQEATQAQGAAIPALLSLQNGVGNEELIEKAWIEKEINPPAIFAGNITTPVSIVETGVIRIEKPKYTIGLGVWKSEVRSQQSEVRSQLSTFNSSLVSLSPSLQKAGFTTVLYPNAGGMKWTKLLMNMAGNASSAILDQAPRVTFANSAVVDMEIDAWREALRVMAAAQIPVVNMDGYPLRWLAPLIQVLPKAMLRPMLRRMIAGGRGAKMPSLHIDLAQGKQKSEIGWLNGAVVKEGKRVGIPTPVNQHLCQTLSTILREGEVTRNYWRNNYKALCEARG